MRLMLASSRDTDTSTGTDFGTGISNRICREPHEQNHNSLRSANARYFYDQN